MFFVDEPYLSDLFKKTVQENQLPIVKTPAADKFSFLPGTKFISEAEAIQAAKSDLEHLRLYTTSENTIGWISQHLAFSGYPQKIELFKNKAKFRRLIQPIYPDFFFREVALKDLGSLKVEAFPFPFITKPAVGFFSLGVHLVASLEDWPATVRTIQHEINQISGAYPNEVLNIDSFIIEQSISGDEFAVDAYFDQQGTPVVLDILHHPFSSSSDVSDRVYMTSKEIIEAHLGEFTELLNKIGALSGIRNFPVHVELRREPGGRIIPIEVNPMRFGGWCSTPDLAYFAYGINPYLYYAHQQKPDWKTLLQDKAGKIYSVVILDNSTGIPVENIASFDYDQCMSHFEKPLELRKIDYAKWGVFAFLFVETRAEHFIELDAILHSNLREFVSLKE